MGQASIPLRASSVESNCVPKRWKDIMNVMSPSLSNLAQILGVWPNRYYISLSSGQLRTVMPSWVCTFRWSPSREINSKLAFKRKTSWKITKSTWIPGSFWIYGENAGLCKEPVERNDSSLHLADTLATTKPVTVPIKIYRRGDLFKIGDIRGLSIFYKI